MVFMASGLTCARLTVLPNSHGTCANAALSSRSQCLMSDLALPPDVLRWTPRYEFEHGDCAVSALSIAGGVTYELALTAAVKIAPDVLVNGLSWEEIRKTARLLDLSPRILRKGKYDLNDATGILAVDQPHVEDSDHAVYLWEGRIIEPKADRRQLWLNAEQFLKHYHYRPGSLMVFDEDEGEE